MDQSPVFDVSAFIDRQKIGATQLMVLGICALAMAIDGFDIYVVGFVLPAIAKDMGVEPALVAPVLFAQLLGLAIGSFLVSPLADRYGRRPVIIACSLVFGLLTLVTSQAHSVTSLSVLRFVAGIFLSGIIPNAIALTSEIAPTRMRSAFVTIMFCGYTAGSAFGGYLAANLVDAFGWQGAFWAGGLLPIVLLPVFWFVLPESLQFRVQHNSGDPRIATYLRRIDPTIPLAGNERFRLNEARVSSAPVTALFRDGRALSTALLWFCFFNSMLAVNLIASWIPTFYSIFGPMSLRQAAGWSVLGSVSGIVSMLVYGAVLDRFGTRLVLTSSYLIGAAAVVAIGLVDWHSWLFVLVIVIEGACVIGAQSGINALSAVLYPTEMRATGVGWAFGIGRVASMFGPAVGGYMLHQKWSVEAVFATCAIPIALVAVGTFLVGFTRPEGAPNAPVPAAAE